MLGLGHWVEQCNPIMLGFQVYREVFISLFLSLPPSLATECFAFVARISPNCRQQNIRFGVWVPNALSVISLNQIHEVLCYCYGIGCPFVPASKPHIF